METRPAIQQRGDRTKPSIEPRSFKRGNAPIILREGGNQHPSIEPRSFKRGNYVNRSPLRVDPLPSIEPRSFKRGNLAPCAHPVGYLSPSIEPRSFKRGNFVSGAEYTFDAEGLQLSHVHSNVETTPCNKKLLPFVAFN